MPENKQDENGISERPLRMLFVEDDLLDVELMADALRRAGFTFTYEIVGTPDLLKRRLEEETWDLIFADYNLGDWTAMDALKILKSFAQDVPFILVTGSLGEEAAVDCIKLGAWDYVLKDRLARLSFAVRRAIEDKRLLEERTATAMELRQAVERYRILFERNLAGIMQTALDGHILNCNDSYARIFGYNSREELLMHRVQEFWFDPEERKALVARVREEGTLRNVELLMRRKDGQPVWVLENLTIVKQSNDIESVIEATLLDITERKQSEQALVKSRENLTREHTLLRTLIDNLPDLIYVKDKESRYLLKNLTDARLMGTDSPELLIGKTDFDFYPAELAARYHEDDQTVIRTGQALINHEEPIIDADGHPRWLSTTKIPLLDGQGHVTGLVGIGHDVTERKMAEQSQNLLATAIEQAAEIVVITDIHGNIKYVNPAFSRVTGYTRDEVIGKNPNILKSDKHTREFYQEMWGTLMRGATWVGRFTNRKKDGTFYAEDAVISPVRDSTGRLAHFVAVKRDVSKELSLEDQLRQSQKMEAVGRLAGGIAHDFNNLLTAIIGYSELIGSQLGPDSPIRKDIEEIEKAGKRATALTNQLLAFSRKQVLQPRLLDLNDIVAKSDKLFRRLLGEDIELVTIFGQGLKLVKADPGQVEQIIINLVVNSRDAMPGGGELTIETSNVTLDEDYVHQHVVVSPGSYVMLAVSDTGCGMDPETMARIFEPFFTTKDLGKGTGLGLSTVYGIVKQSGGYIWAYSEPGQGSAFKIYLPTVPKVLEDKAITVSPSTVQVRGDETILLVEDDASVRNLARSVLEKNGYQILEAHQGSEALRVAIEHKGPIHLLLTDVVMPHLSGRQLADRMIALRPQTKILYMSGYTDDAIVHHGVLDSGLSFIQKPFTVNALLQKVREVLEAPPVE